MLNFTNEQIVAFTNPVIIGDVMVITECNLFDLILESDELSWDEECEALKSFQRLHPGFHYYAKPSESFSITAAAQEASDKGCYAVIVDCLS